MENEFIELVKNAGVIGAGGAGFPTYAKLNAKVEKVIVNGAECEPLLKVDQQLMDKYAGQLCFALCRVLKETSAKKGVIALKGKYKEAIKSLQGAIVGHPELELFILDNFYPAGDEQVLVYEVAKKIVPEGGIPLNVGVIVMNVETLLNVYNAFNEKPVTDKYLTITGEVRHPKTIKVPVGISIREVIEQAGGSTVEEFTVLDGGPMMGKIIENIDEPIKKTTKGLIVLPKDHLIITNKNRSVKEMIKQASIACCNCSLCSEVCPRHLLGHSIEPHKIMRIASYGQTCDNELSATNAFLCSECGLCEQACVMGLQSWKLNKFFKEQLTSRGIRNTHKNIPEDVDGFREYRKYPVNKLKARLNITKYDYKAELIEEAYDFNKVKILTRQHIGAKAVPVVTLNEEVAKGDLIGKVEEGKLGANIHASINGIITEVNDDYIIIEKKL